MGAAGTGSREAVGAGAQDSAKVAGARWVTLLLALYHLCCWPPDNDSDTSSDRSRRRGIQRHESGSHRRASEFFSRRMGSSAASLHLPSTSGQQREAPSAHRSHEEIGRRRSHGGGGEAARYHSAPSVIDEVLHRRDWERSTRDLYIPLRSPTDPADPADPADSSPGSEPDPPVSSPAPPPAVVCKKHHTNIKSSSGKEKRSADDKDLDATELYHFYIGDNECGARTSSPRREDARGPVAIVAAKETKQSLNESIRSKERGGLAPLAEHGPLGAGLQAAVERLAALDRSGAARHSLESRVSVARVPLPPPSVEAVGYEGGAVYLREAGAPARVPPPPAQAPPAPGPGLRARHASDGDILAPTHRPESGAFSESDLYLDAEAEELPPPYHDPPLYSPSHHRKETAI